MSNLAPNNDSARQSEQRRRRLWQRVLDGLLPHQCFVCGLDSGASVVCRACTAELPQLGACCPVCALPLPLPVAQVCGACQNEPPAFDGTVAAFSYAFPVDKMVSALKYRGQLSLAHFFAEALLQRALPVADCVVPVPLHPRRLRERGFNQALEIARALSRERKERLCVKGVERSVYQAPQASLSWLARQSNVRNAFTATRRFDGETVLVLDDVMTTGATLDAVARVLKRQGARRVINVVVARTPPP